MRCRTLLFSILAVFPMLRAASADDCAAYEKYRCEGATYPVHLTFDDGPASGPTDQVLDALKKHGLTATFFVVGERLAPGSPKAHFELVKRMLAEGHTVGSHGYRHVMHSALSKGSLDSFLKEVKTVGRSQIGEYLSPILRLPFGDGWYNGEQKPAFNRLIMAKLREAGFSHVGWDITTYDWDLARQRDGSILPTFLEGICRKKGGVVLLERNSTSGSTR
jgi:peptidoglycan/xylan/chitin deacetylase (PgdA/CDA1 family)